MIRIQRTILVSISVLLAATLPFTPSTKGQTSAKPRDDAQAAKVWPQQAVRAAHGMVATDEELGSQAGVEILKRGGNAVDAAVAVAFALAVVEPAAGNIGGGGFMLVRLASGKTTFFDYREVAPGKATRDMYIDKDGNLDKEASVIGYRSVAVPGTVAGLELALKTYGTMKLADVMAPAIRLAEGGFPVSEKLAREFDRERPGLQPFSLSARIFLNAGQMFKAGDTLRQPELAATLKRIAKNGAAEFYRGETARMLARDMAGMGGLVTLDDLGHYSPKIREVLRAKYESGAHTWEVLTSPPPSSGGVAVIEALNMLQGVPLKGWDDPQSVHIVAATIDARHASTSKEVKAGTPHACGISAKHDPAPQTLLSPGEGPHTTHFSVVDAAGNAVASTYTLNDNYGSHVTCSAGFLLNDEMDDFTTQPGVPNALFGLIQSEANAIAPGHRPLSSMTPTILLRDGKLSFVTGSPGGPTIISATLLSVINWMKLDMEAQAAINAPRFHHQWLPDRILMEQQFPPALEQALNAMGHATKRRGHIGLVNAIGIDPQTGERLGAADPRDDGAAVGY